MTERHSLIELRTMWTASRDFCQRQLDHCENYRLAGTGGEYCEGTKDYDKCVATSQANIDKYTALLAEKVWDDMVGITLA